MRVAVVGCGDVAFRYGPTFAGHAQLELVGATDLAADRAERFVRAFGGRAYPSLDHVLADPSVDAIAVLTVPQTHASIVRAALEAGKHVHSEKPLALTATEAWELARLADERGLRLGSSPVIFLGEAQQTLAHLVADGRLGAVRLAYAEVNWGRIEGWHPEPISLYDVGALVDVGVYPVTTLTALFGPVRRVTGYARLLEPERRTLDGRKFELRRPDFVVALLELERGPLVRLTATFYAEPSAHGRGIELHGDAASAHLESWQHFDSPLRFAPRGEQYTAVPLVRPPYRGVDWALALAELADAIAERRRHRTSARHAAHVLDVLEATYDSAETGRPVDVSSDFPLPAARLPALSAGAATGAGP